MADINIVLMQPEIPQNTGNIARTCASTGAALHLVRPMGFEVDNSKLKRAGLDYWSELDITYYDSTEDFFSKNAGESFYFFSKKAASVYSNIDYPRRVFLIFGRESEGLPEDMLLQNKERCLRIPMREGLRSLNLSNTVAIAVYEIFRRRNFEGLEAKGHLFI